jgi:hypothetical protein
LIIKNSVRSKIGTIMPDILPILGSLLPDDLRPLVEAAALPDLHGTSAQPTLKDSILKWELTYSNGATKGRFSDELQDLILAALWLLEGDLEQSHRFSQRWETLNGSYWHAIMHRREGDYSNAKYWYRRTSKSPVINSFKQTILSHHALRAFVPELVRPMDPADWLEAWVEVNRQTTSPEASDRFISVVRDLAWIEWQLLLAHCFHIIR